MTAPLAAALAIALQTSVIAGHDFSQPKLSSQPWTALDVLDADKLRLAYESKPVGSPWSAYPTKVFWRDSRHGSMLQVLLLKLPDFPVGEFLQPESHRLIILDGGCAVVQTQLDEADRVRFVCNGNA